MLFNRKDDKPYVDQVDEFVTDMAAPVRAHELELGDHTSTFETIVGLSSRPLMEKIEILRTPGSNRNRGEAHALCWLFPQ